MANAVSMDGRARPEGKGWAVAVHLAADDPEPAGGGVLLDDTRVLTCAGVVPEKAGAWVAFPGAGEDLARRRVREIISPDAGSPIPDLVILVLAEPAPAGVRPAPLRCPRPADLVGKRWRAFGFPKGAPLGDFADGRVGGVLDFNWGGWDGQDGWDGWIWLDRESSRLAEPGFSGAGLWSADYQAVVGIVSHADPARGDVRAITLHRAGQRFPGQDLRVLAEQYSVSDAGPAALTEWGWPLPGDSGRGYRFRGRSAAASAITGWLGGDGGDGGVLLVTGDPGCGKSAVLGRIAVAGVGPVACAVHAGGRTALEIAATIARAASAALPERLEDFPHALRKALAERHATRFGVIIDALDQAAGPAGVREVISKVILPVAATCAGARLVVGTRRRDADGDLLAAIGPAARIVDLDRPEYFAPGDLAACALAALRQAVGDRPGSPYAGSGTAGPVAERIALLCSPSFLATVLTARMHGLWDEAAADPAGLSSGPGVDDALREYLRRVPDAGGVPAGTVLTPLAFAEPPGLPVSLWRTALRALGGGDIPESELERFARSEAAGFLAGAADGDSGTRYRLFHPAVSDALLRARGLIAARRDDEQALTGAFMAAGRRSGWDRAPGYLLRSLPGHAARAGMADTLLADDDYLLHADLPRVRQAAGQARSAAGRRRARLLRLSPPEAVTAGAPARAAMFSVTDALEGIGDSCQRGAGQVPYRAAWAVASPTEEHLILRGHDGEVNAVCRYTAADGTPRLATASSDETIRIWDPETATETRALYGHGGWVLSVCSFTAADGSPRLASVSHDQIIRIWDPDTGIQIRAFRGGRAKSVCSFTAADGSSRLATASDDATVCVWDPETGARIRALRGHNGRVRSVCSFTAADGVVRLASASSDETVRIWDPEAGVRIRTLYGHDGEVNAVCCYTAADGTPRLATASGDETVCIWDPGSGERIRVLEGHDGWVFSVCAFTTADGDSRLASVSNDATVRVWTPESGAGIRALSGHDGGVNEVCSFTAADGASRLATASWDETVCIWDPGSGERIRALEGHDGGVSAVCSFTAADGASRLASASKDATVRIWDPETGAGIRVLHGHDLAVRSVCSFTAADGKSRLATASIDDSVRVWDPETGTERLALYGHNGRVRSVCSFTAADGVVRLASASSDETVRIWDPETGAEIRTLHGHNGWVWSVCSFTAADGKPRLATASSDSTVRVWDPELETSLLTVPVRDGALSVAWSGGLLVVGLATGVLAIRPGRLHRPGRGRGARDTM